MTTPRLDRRRERHGYASEDDVPSEHDIYHGVAFYLFVVGFLSLIAFAFTTPVGGVLPLVAGGGVAVVGSGVVGFLAAYHHPGVSWGVTPPEDDRRDFIIEDVDGDDLVAEGRRFPQVGERIMTEIERVYSPEDSDDVRVEVMLPDGPDSWRFDYPYVWDEEECELASMAANYGYGPDDFTEMEGDPALVLNGEESVKLLMNEPESWIHRKVDDGELSRDDIRAEAVEERFGVDLPEFATGEEIIIEDSPLDDQTLDDMR